MCCTVLVSASTFDCMACLSASMLACMPDIWFACSSWYAASSSWRRLTFFPNAMDASWSLRMWMLSSGKSS